LSARFHLIVNRISIFLCILNVFHGPLGAVTVRQSAVVPPPENSSTKKADVIDLTLESSSDDEDDDDDEDSDPPLKKRCVYMSKAEDMHSKGFVFIHLIKPGIF